MKELKDLVNINYNWNEITDIRIEFFDNTKPNIDIFKFKPFPLKRNGRDAYICNFDFTLEPLVNITNFINEINKLHIPYILDFNFGNRTWMSYMYAQLVLVTFEDCNIEYNKVSRHQNEDDLCEDFPVLRENINIARVIQII